MTPIRGFASAAILVSFLAAAPGGAQTPGPDAAIYVLTPQSEFEWGCFGPCECPVLVRQPLLGSFELTRLASGPLFDEYAVTNVSWKVEDGGAPVVIDGAGTYERGGEVALQERLTLDLSFNGGPKQRFDSGLVSARAAFPGIHLDISLHDRVCLDSVITLDAKPIDAAGVIPSPGQERLAAVPSPFGGSTEVDFTLSRDDRIDLAIVDVTGRQVRSLARGEWLAAGLHRRTWDGARENGSAAAPGLYYIRLRTAGGVHARTVVKLH